VIAMTSNPSDREQPEAEYAIAPGMPVVVRIFRRPGAAGTSLSAEGNDVWITSGQVSAIAVGAGLIAAGTLGYLLSAVTP